MGRPLKIKQASEATGTGIDIGFPNFASLTNPVYPTGNTMESADFLGVVGGTNTVDSAQYPTVTVRVRLTGQSNADGYIITQKGSTKYLVASLTSVNDEDLVVGRTYRILSAGTTNWTACGATGGNPQAGDIFTATAAGSGTGTAQQVGTCVLVNKADGALAAGEMSITMSVGDSAGIRISRLTNKYALDYSTPPVRYAINFFQDGGTTIKSGTSGSANVSGQQNLLTLAVIEQYNS
jgi:hypothetical protein